MALLLTTATANAENTGVKAWTAAIAADAVRWTSSIAPPDYMSGSETEAGERLLPLLDRTVPVPVKSLPLTTPELGATDRGGEVWSMSAREEGVTYLVGSRRRGEAWQPLYFCATGLTAQPDPVFDEALARMLSVVLRNGTGFVCRACPRSRGWGTGPGDVGYGQRLCLRDFLWLPIGGDRTHHMERKRRVGIIETERPVVC